MKNLFNKNIKFKELKNVQQKTLVANGREWTEEEKEKYYENFSYKYSDWKNEVLKLLFEKKLLDYDTHTIYKSNLELKMNASFNARETPVIFVDRFVNKVDTLHD